MNPIAPIIALPKPLYDRHSARCIALGILATAPFWMLARYDIVAAKDRVIAARDQIIASQQIALRERCEPPANEGDTVIQSRVRGKLHCEEVKHLTGAKK